MTNKFFVCVDGVCVRDGKILLLKRNVEPFKGCWHVVGGHVEENETLKEALKKEFKEETNFGGRWVNGCPKRRASDRIKVIIVFQRLQLKEKSSLTLESEEFGCSPKSQLTPSTTTPNTCQKPCKPKGFKFTAKRKNAFR